MKPENLQGEARRRWETWVSLGLSEAAALHQLYRDGLLRRDADEQLVENFRSLGLSEEAAATAAAGRDGRRPSGGSSSRLQESFRDLRAAYEALGYSRELAATSASDAIREAYSEAAGAADRDQVALDKVKLRIGHLRYADANMPRP